MSGELKSTGGLFHTA